MTQDSVTKAREEAERILRTHNAWALNGAYILGVALIDPVAEAIEQAERRGVVRGLRMAVDMAAKITMGNSAFENVIGDVLLEADRIEKESASSTGKNIEKVNGEEIVAWLVREIAPQRLPGHVKIMLTEKLANLLDESSKNNRSWALNWPKEEK